MLVAQALAGLIAFGDAKRPGRRTMKDGNVTFHSLLFPTVCPEIIFLSIYRNGPLHD